VRYQIRVDDVLGPREEVGGDGARCVAAGLDVLIRVIVG
jgi:hypothetical protein